MSVDSKCKNHTGERKKVGDIWQSFLCSLLETESARTPTTRPSFSEVSQWSITEMYSNTPRPRLCHVRRWPNFNGFGFNLHAERNKVGQFIGKVDRDSPAEAAGLREHDRIVEVNYVPISNDSHKQVVARIKQGVERNNTFYPDEVIMLVLDPEAADYYSNKGIMPKSFDSNVEHLEAEDRSEPLPTEAPPSYESKPTSDQAQPEQPSTPTKRGDSNIHYKNVTDFTGPTVTQTSTVREIDSWMPCVDRERAIAVIVLAFSEEWFVQRIQRFLFRELRPWRRNHPDDLRRRKSLIWGWIFHRAGQVHFMIYLRSKTSPRCVHRQIILHLMRRINLREVTRHEPRPLNHHQRLDPKYLNWVSENDAIERWYHFLLPSDMTAAELMEKLRAEGAQKKAARQRNTMSIQAKHAFIEKLWTLSAIIHRSITLWKLIWPWK